MGVHFHDLVQNFHIRRAELVLRNFFGRDPFNVVVLQLLRNSFGNCRVKQGQLHRHIRVFVDDRHKHLSDRERDRKLLPAFANERLLLRLSRLHLAADELPEKPPRLVRGPLADHEFVVVPNQGGHDGHRFVQTVLRHSIIPFQKLCVIQIHYSRTAQENQRAHKLTRRCVCDKVKPIKKGS